MALFGDALIHEIAALVRQRYQALGLALGVPPAPERGDELGEDSRLRHDLALLVGVANGEYRRTDALVQQVEQTLAQLLDLLLGNALQTTRIVPASFWQTEIGVLASRVRWWISGDDLITISNAAALAFGENTQANRMRIARAMDNGVLEWVPDPSVANPQQNRRVLRSQVERLRDLSRLPE
ncbi:MAG: hypothetical protein JOZ51_22005 [Chloroflexi bacterium]|nr:hypothetical protein [Chloroflexota bacterium]